ncbi:threonine/serine exporter family protein [Aliarcobacter butzleri]|uniref:threonine/serine exporter family protein n=1 Tax=Aliarcobacter butzleri TaxID=28197 RepID=UPI0012FAC210|nr:threonine/serine exporter family protein [Aliarcobacter butzleri]MBF7069938.1 threonine/serine exporter [Aliarcobacter butzleri]
MDFVLKLIVEGLFASFAAVGFAIVFNVPKETLKYCAIGGAIAYDVRTVLLNLNLGIELSTFLASTIVGIIALHWSRKYLIPRPVYTVASIIPIIPGTFAFSAMISLVDMNTHGVTPELIQVFLYNGLKAVAILGAITFGLALPSLYFMRFNRPII